MIDIHCHILPGVDDGSSRLEDSFAMAEVAIAEGITHILVTPHHKNGRYNNFKKDIIEKTNSLQEELNNRKLNLTIFPGQEVRIHGEILEEIKKNEILFTDELSRYILIEFPTMSIPHYAESLFFQLMQEGITPIIVHPERNQEIIEDPNRLLDFVDKGILTQLTASSYVGVFGKEIASLSRQLIEANLVHILASDAHNTRGRSFHMQEGYEKMIKEFGEEKANWFKENAKHVVNGDYINIENPSEIKKKRSFFSFFK